jgi:hypothetical protein
MTPSLEDYSESEIVMEMDFDGLSLKLFKLILTFNFNPMSILHSRKPRFMKDSIVDIFVTCNSFLNCFESTTQHNNFVRLSTLSFTLIYR